MKMIELTDNLDFDPDNVSQIKSVLREIESKKPNLKKEDILGIMELCAVRKERRTVKQFTEEVLSLARVM